MLQERAFGAAGCSIQTVYYGRAEGPAVGRRNYSATTSKGISTETSLWKLILAVYLPSSFTGSLSTMSLRSTLWPSFSRASAIWMLLTEPKMVPVAEALAPMVRATSASAAAAASASALILASLWAR